MSHDPLCPMVAGDCIGGAHHVWGSMTAQPYCARCDALCECQLIAKVRDDTLDKARSAVASNCFHTKFRGCHPCDHDYALAAIDAIRGGRNRTKISTDTAQASVPMSQSSSTHSSVTNTAEGLLSSAGGPTTCGRGCRDGLLRVASSTGDDSEVDVCPCQR